MAKIPVKIGIIGGSGLDDPDLIKNAQQITVTTPFGEPSSPLTKGTINGVECVLISRHGKKHSICPSKVNYRANVWALKEAGCTHVLASSACGSLQKDVVPGDIVVPDSFIDRTTLRINTFYDNTGPFPEKVLHIPMEPAFCNETREIIIDAAKSLNIPCHSKGTSVIIEGPRFSSLAESHLYRRWGAHLVNMTLVPEVILAKEAGLLYACIAMATDYDCWNEGQEIVNVENVVKKFMENVDKVISILICSIEKIASRDWDEHITKLQNTVKGSFQNKE